MHTPWRPTRRRLLGRGPAVLAVSASTARAGSALQLVHVTALNCGFCAAFEARRFEEMRDLVASRDIAARVVRVARFQSHAEDPFPEDLDWPKRAGARSGTPRFLLVRGGRIVASAFVAREAGIVPTLVGRDGRRHGEERMGEGETALPAHLPLPVDRPVAGGRPTIEPGVCGSADESHLPVELDVRIPDDRRGEAPESCGRGQTSSIR